MRLDTGRTELFVLKRGDRFGILLRRIPAIGSTESAYFTLRDDSELLPGESVRSECGEYNCHRLDGLQPHLAILHEFRVHAEFLADRPLREKRRASAEYAQGVKALFDHSPDRRGYHESPLRKFLHNRQLLSKEFLLRRMDHVVAASERFEVIAPEHLFPKVSILQTNDDVLRVASPLRDGWFAKTGPLFADFTADRVYRRKELDQLKQCVDAHRACILVGDIASGKSVVLRHLAYELRGTRLVYWLLGDDFEPADVVAEIKRLRGLIIIEDIHRQVRLYQQLLQRLPTETLECKLLFCGRPSFEQAQDSRLPRFDELPRIQLHASSALDGILDQTAQVQCQRRLADTERVAIKPVIGSNLWLLRYALQGLKDAPGTDPRSWVAAGVREDLNDLRQYGGDCPAIAVSVSAMSSAEVGTAESFLTGPLGFKAATLDHMVDIGELRRFHFANGSAYYMSPHAALAEAYWEHGSRYWSRIGMSSWCDVVRAYLALQPPNGLRAVLACQEYGADVLGLPGDTDVLVELILAEESLRSIIDWVVRNDDMGADLPEVVASLAARVSRSRELRSAATLVRALPGTVDFDDFLRHIDVAALATACSTPTSVSDLMGAMAVISALGEWPTYRAPTGVYNEQTRRLCESIDASRAAASLDAIGDLLRTCSFVRWIWSGSPRNGASIWRLLDKSKLSQLLKCTKDPTYLVKCLVSLRDLPEKAEQEFVALIDPANLLSILRETPRLAVGAQLIGELSLVPGEETRATTARLDALAANELVGVDFGETAAAIQTLRSGNAQLARQFGELLSMQKVAEAIHRQSAGDDKFARDQHNSRRVLARDEASHGLVGMNEREQRELQMLILELMEVSPHQVHSLRKLLESKGVNDAIVSADS